LFTKLTADKLGGAAAYRSLADAYKGKGNEAKQIETLKAGRTAFPNDGNLIFAELDIYLQKGQDKEALENLNLAIQKDPKNAVLYGVLANIHDRLKILNILTPLIT
jgi:tetratricopeptide (TPR) repeat protein